MPHRRVDAASAARKLWCSASSIPLSNGIDLTSISANVGKDLWDETQAELAKLGKK